jgi:mycofactocin precursor
MTHRWIHPFAAKERFQMLDNAVHPATTTTPVPEASAPQRPQADTGDERQASLIVDDLLVEDVSIDGMCGVY